jgi:hypothetical protein
MTPTLYSKLKGRAYPALAAVAGCDHQKAASNGYKDGWQMLLDHHDDNEMAMFCLGLPKMPLSEDEATVLLDGLAREYTQFADWRGFVDACVAHPDWKPSKGPIAMSPG